MTFHSRRKYLCRHTEFGAGTLAFTGKLGHLCCMLQALHEQEPQEYVFQSRNYFKYAKLIFIAEI